MKKFNIRCYAIIINDNNEILLSDEFLGNHFFTKFIGGGLEFGEGTKDCVVREIKEEIGVEASVDELFYVNDFFQASAFNPNEQIVSFYFTVRAIDYHTIPISQDYQGTDQKGERFRWLPIDQLNINDVTFPIDKEVVKKINRELDNLQSK